jgi:2-oxoisovalerate dehydrogenase E1 component
MQNLKLKLLSEELNDIYKPFVFEEVKPQQKKKNTIYRCYFASLNNQWNVMTTHGQDISEYGGAFKITDGFVAQFVKNE